MIGLAHFNLKNVMFYYPMPDEVNIFETLQWHLDLHEELILMRFGKNKTMIPYAIEDFDDLEENKYGILIPEETCRKVDPNTLEAVVIPGRAFDHSLNRIGRGYGYYDRFLAKYPAMRIGIAHDFQIFKSVPVEEHDIKMDMLITETMQRSSAE